MRILGNFNIILFSGFEPKKPIYYMKFSYFYIKLDKIEPKIFFSHPDIRDTIRNEALNKNYHFFMKKRGKFKINCYI